MTRDEFQKQIDRLVSVYGKTAYPEERLALIWKEVADFDQPWLAREIDLMIGTFRQAPLLEVFSEAATKERERRWQKEREAEKTDAKAFFTGRRQYDGAEALRFQMVRDLLSPNLSAESRASILAHFGPSDLGLDDHAALLDPKRPGPMTMEPSPMDAAEAAALAERQRRSLPYIDN